MSDNETRTNEVRTDVIVKLIGEDGNVFGIIGNVSRALKRAGHRELADEFRQKAFKSGSYDAVLALVQEYVIVE